jgi:ubiquitin-conjugating enzyme E2 variant
LNKKSEIMRLRAGYSVTQRLAQVIGIALFFAWSLYILIRSLSVAQTMDVAHPGLLIPVAIVAGYLFADLASGIVHWLGDNYGSESWPLLGSGFIRPFRHHHVAPKDICEHGFVQLNGNNCLVSLLTFWWATIPAVTPESGAMVVFLGFFWLAVAWFTFATNQFHSWAHADEAPRFARWLQDKKLILSPALHNVHHQPPHHKSYCITTGLMDAPLRWLAFFPILEWSIEKISGVAPLHRTRAEKPDQLVSEPVSSH